MSERLYALANEAACAARRRNTTWSASSAKVTARKTAATVRHASTAPKRFVTATNMAAQARPSAAVAGLPAAITTASRRISSSSRLAPVADQPFEHLPATGAK